MKRWLSVALCLLLLVLPSLTCAASQTEINRQVDSYFTRSKTVGGALVVFQDGEIVYQRYYGYQDTSNYAPVTQDTYFRVASVTKMVSAVGILQLMEQGLVDLDEDIGTYFGYEIANTYYPDTPITLRQLMSHTSTVSEKGGYSNGNTIHDMLSKEIARRGNFTDNRPGSVYAYSNFGAGIVGAILEAVTGVSVNQYMREHVFDPLGIDASYDPALLQDTEDITDLFKSDGTRYRSAWGLIRDGYEDFADPENHYATTVGKLWIRADDLAKIAIALCGDGTVDGMQLLAPETVALMRKDPSTVGVSVLCESPYGLFLERVDTLVEGRTLYGHQGMVAGVLCNVYFDPQTQFGFVMLTNGCNNVLDNHIGVLARRQFTYTYQTFAGAAGPIE